MSQDEIFAKIKHSGLCVISRASDRILESLKGLTMYTMATTQILIVDDSTVCANYALQAVNKLGYAQIAYNYADALKALESKTWDLVILDIHLGEENGFKVFEDMQKNPKWNQIPVIFVSGDAEISQKSLAFSLGADDYVVKPYNFHELQMRVNRTLKRNNTHQDYITMGPFKLSTHQMQLQLEEDQGVNKVELSPKEYQLMKFLMENPNQIFSRQQLLDKVWGQDIYITDRTIDTHIYSLRKKLSSHGKLLLSVRSMGYQLVSPSKSIVKQPA